MKKLLNIHHRTVYRYELPVQFGLHHLRLRPIEDHHQRLFDFQLQITPTPRLRWGRDLFHNIITFSEFNHSSSELVIESSSRVEVSNHNPFDFFLSPEAVEYPFFYPEEERPALEPFLLPLYPEDQRMIHSWMRPFLDLEGRAKTLDFLLAINRTIPRMFSYVRRPEIGIQSPSQTIHLRSGSCRDFALLLMETARTCGIAARFVSGYLVNFSPHEMNSFAVGAMHAWTQLYLPGAGWLDFDPTSGILTGLDHVRVAVGRTPQDATPIQGAFSGNPGQFQYIDVDVKVQEVL